MQSLDRDVLTINRMRKFSRKAVEYRLTYALVCHLSDDSTATSGKDEIKHITKIFKAHRSEMDADYGFISHS